MLGPLSVPLGKLFSSSLASHWLAVVLVAAIPAQQPQAPEHPLMPIIRYAEQRLQQIDSQIRDYTCILVKRERLEGALSDYQYIYTKVRQEQRSGGRIIVPFSVYCRYLAPADVAGREVIYVEGRNKGKMIVRRGGERFAYVTTSLDPRGELAMQEARYPITEVGIRNLVVRLLQVAHEDLKHDECQVRSVDGAKIDGRACTFVEVTHPVRRPYFRYYKAQIFVDDELQLPVRYASYDWPAQEGGQPVLLEEYTFRNIQLNVGLTDADFDFHNPQYGFRKDYEP